MVADQELNASADGKWAKQSEDAKGNPLVMVNMLAHDLKLCLAQWPASEKRYEPAVLREQLGRLFQSYPGLGLLTMDALYAERDVCHVGHGRDYLADCKVGPREMGVCGYGCGGTTLEQVPDPRKARGVRHPFQAILRLTLLGLVCYGPHRVVRQDALAGAERAVGVSQGRSSSRHHHFAHLGWGAL